MVLYEGNILGFNYYVKLADDTAFKTWLKDKLTRYLLKSPEIEVLKELLGIDTLDQRLKSLGA